MRIIEFNGNDKVGDKEINCKIINKLYEKGCTNVEYIPYNKNVQFMYSKIQECDIILSSRLHAAIFACFSNIPFFLIEYHKKCEDFLTDIGYNENYRIYDGKKEINKLMINIEDILHNNKSYIYPCYIEECKQRALCNFTSIKI